MTLSAVTYERLVAVRLRARYNNVFTSKRVVKFMAAIWALNILLTSLQWAGMGEISKGTHYIIWFLCLLGSVLANVGIGLILRRHNRQLQPHSAIPENIRRKREMKLTRNISIIVGVYLLFNVPLFFIKMYRHIFRQKINSYNHYSWTETLAFLNSCTNPFLCYWKNRQIRQCVKTIPERITCHLVHSDKHMNSPQYTRSVAKYTSNTADVSLGL